MNPRQKHWLGTPKAWIRPEEKKEFNPNVLFWYIMTMILGGMTVMTGGLTFKYESMFETLQTIGQVGIAIFITSAAMLLYCVWRSD